MRYLMYSMDKVDPAPPTPALLAEMGKFTEDAKRSGNLLATGGLGPTSTRVRNAGGKFTVTDGPFTETKELTGGFALIEAKSKDEAIEWARRFRKIVGDGESVIQEVFGG
jgi:hypothetical protein